MREETYKIKVYCPLVKREIGDLLCEDVAFASEGAIPARFAPQEFRDKANWKERCMNCEKHPE